MVQLHELQIACPHCNRLIQVSLQGCTAPEGLPDLSKTHRPNPYGPVRFVRGVSPDPNLTPAEAAAERVRVRIKEGEWVRPPSPPPGAVIDSPYPWKRDEKEEKK